MLRLSKLRKLAETGAGIQVTPNSSTLLKRWGLRVLLEFRSEAKYNELPALFRWYDSVQRAKLCRQLEEKLGKSLKVTLSSVRMGYGRGAEKFYWGNKTTLKQQGTLSTASFSTQKTSPPGELRDKITNPELNIWFGPDCHAVPYSIRSGKALGLGLVRPDDLLVGLARFLDHVKVVETWKLMHRQEVETWINDKGNFVLIGDASHPMIPYLAQGANSAIEDGATIGLTLGKITSKLQLPQALQMFQAMRKARGEAIESSPFV
ncbi:hypothetical protein GMDG_05161 [Pseudogymnoascus destructans 20631-21]|uniref:FAD-binding domain-containing protein n=1 Tax=Pseudogymnoascus destructans (strain ATCC MYA-4855 / 20631-21) TaxID=658429 RepID=L8FM35_PSED2|nr:hypothetical protein GMDG_05161 [Pseudogymnoascus destructans 20631-21]